MLRQSTFPRGGRLNRLRTRLSFRGVVEKSHTIETETVVYVMRRDEGVPPYRRLRRESDTMSFRALAKKFKTELYTFAPAHLPAVAHCREIPCDRNENNHTPITPNTCQQGLPAAKKEADETSASVNRCPVCPNPTRRVENQAYVYEFCRDFADIVLLVESYLITPSLMVREKRSLRPRRISSGITRALCPSAST